MATQKISIADKSPGDQFLSSEFNTIKSVINNNADSRGDYDDFSAGFGSSSSLADTILDSYSKSELPLNAPDGTTTLVTDGTVGGAPTMAYFYQGKWYRTLDNSLISDQVIDLYFIAGQSNAHGHADVSTLDVARREQPGLFYTSWHADTSNASSEQLYSDWASSLVAGSTRGDSYNLVNSPKFGPELGFASKASAIQLAGSRPIGIIKHAIGASTLVDEGTTYSDWDLTATGDRRGDALRAFKLAVADATNKLDSANYTYRLAGMIWWQGESGASVNDLQALISHLRDWFDANYTLDIAKANFPFVITKIGYGTDLTPVAAADDYVGIVNAGDYGHSGSQNHVGDPADGSADTDSNGVNDMFEIGEAYALQMELAKSGSTVWTPDNITTRLWIDAADASTLLYDGSGNVTTIKDKSVNQTDLLAQSSSTITAIPTGLNSKNVLSFDNNADATSYKNLALASNTRHKWFMVMKATASDSSDGFLTYRSQSPTNELILFNYSTAGNFKAEWYVNSGTGMRGNTTNLLGTWNILSVEFDIPSARSSAWLNGAAYNTNVSQNGVNYASIGAGQLSINQYATKGGADWAELIFTEDPTQADSDKIEGYLAHKWGLESQLPASHPYSTSAP